MIHRPPCRCAMPDPTPRSDPEGYLALRKFSLRLPKCPRTGLPVSYADIGDPSGTPVLFLLPSGCSRWLAVPQDPLAKRYGIRLIAVDRPGTGTIPMVPLKDRIRLSCEMMVSVLEDLHVKLAHMIVTSGGIYYALHLLLHHSNIFLTQLNPPPTLYLVAPWSPLLPSTHPDYYSSTFTWIPDKLIETQHITLPHLLKVAEGAYSAWSISSEAVGTGWSFAKSLWSGQTPEQSTSAAASIPVVQAIPDGLSGVEDIESDEEEIGANPWRRFSKLWGNFPEIFTETISDYFNAENQGAVGQGKSPADLSVSLTSAEHLQCLDRGPEDTGYQWLENSFNDLAAALSSAQVKEAPLDGLPIPRPMPIHVWWGWQDSMVPRQGQLWFNKVVQSHPKELHVEIHNIPNGDHGDLMMRRDGVGVVYSLIRAQGHSTEKSIHLHPDCEEI